MQLQNTQDYGGYREHAIRLRRPISGGGPVAIRVLERSEAPCINSGDGVRIDAGSMHTDESPAVVGCWIQHQKILYRGVEGGTVGKLAQSFDCHLLCGAFVHRD